MTNKLAIQDGTKQLAIGTDDKSVKIANTLLAAATNPKVVFVDEKNKVLGSANIPTAYPSHSTSCEIQKPLCL